MEVTATKGQIIKGKPVADQISENLIKEVDELVKGLPVIPPEYQPKIKLINKKPILPSEKELNENSRSRSAKLRIIERIWFIWLKKEKKINVFF